MPVVLCAFGVADDDGDTVRVCGNAMRQLVNDAGTCLDHIEKIESYFSDVRCVALESMSMHTMAYWRGSALGQF